MPLHLLGKKSWNVYNVDNIERVRRDEVAAEEREAEEERRMQEVDAERRIQILRGQRPSTPPLPAAEEGSKEHKDKEGHNRSERPAKRKRKLAGEDDTDRDIRLAKENAGSASAGTEKLEALTKQPVKSTASSNAPITDPKGHINLFPMNDRGGSRSKVEKNKEAEAESAKKKREYEDQYTMRFSNAAGFKQGLEKPWYSSNTQMGDEVEETVSKNVWGNEDPGRKHRDKARIEARDPLASMKSGVRQLKQVERRRSEWNNERARELEDLRRAQKRSQKRERRDDLDDLEGFSLEQRPNEQRTHRSHRRSRSPGLRRSSDRSHHRHSHREHRDSSSRHNRQDRQEKQLDRHQSSRHYHTPIVS